MSLFMYFIHGLPPVKQGSLLKDGTRNLILIEFFTYQITHGWVSAAVVCVCVCNAYNVVSEMILLEI
jgi:hypothetical protein